MLEDISKSFIESSDDEKENNINKFHKEIDENKEKGHFMQNGRRMIKDFTGISSELLSSMSDEDMYKLLKSYQVIFDFIKKKNEGYEKHSNDILEKNKEQ